MRHVVAQGARRIAVIGSDEERTSPMPTSRLRLQGVQRALGEVGLYVNPQLEVNRSDWTIAGGADATEQLLARRLPFDAIVAFTDSLAAGALHVLRRHGIDVPGDVLVTGFDDVELSRFTSPSLSTVEIDLPAYAEAAVHLLVSRIADRSGPVRSVIVPHRLHTRESTAALPRGHRP